jgi:hypothetical protein
MCGLDWYGSRQVGRSCQNGKESSGFTKSKGGEDFLGSWAIINYSRRYLLRGHSFWLVSYLVSKAETLLVYIILLQKKTIRVITTSITIINALLLNWLSYDYNRCILRLRLFEADFLSPYASSLTKTANV